MNVSVRGTRFAAATLAAGIVTLTASPASATDAATFFGGCPGGFTVFSSETVTGAASIPGNCQVDVKPGATLTFDNVQVDVAGSFSTINNGTIVVVNGTSITTDGGLTLDGGGIMTIADSTLISETGGINIPPRDSLFITDSVLSAATTITLGGAGGVRSILGSSLSAVEGITVATASTSITGTPSSVVIGESLLESDGFISIGGAAYHTILDSELIAGGEWTGGNATLTVAPSALDSAPSEIRRTRLSAPDGTFHLGGNGQVTLEEVEVFAGGIGGTSYHGAAAELGPSNAIATRLTVNAPAGVVHLGGGNGWSCENCRVVSGGASSENIGIYVGPFQNISMTDTRFHSKGGSIKMGGNGNVVLEGSKLQGDVASTLGHGVIVGPSGTRSIIDSALKSKDGKIEVTGNGDGEVLGSKIKGNDDAGVFLTGAQDMNVTDSNVVSKKGIVRMSNGGDVVAAGSIFKAGGELGFIAENGFSSDTTSVTENKIKAPEATIHSFGNATAIDNKFKVEGDIDIHGDDSCTSVGNDPDVPCN
ncbi:MAG TPA: right-handed parallel beta-helix repeat-containing protein [Candidatus Binatia bacterium]|nr:right-handed parallel beta-helix repeat-containing protein [Candidatus Binatia bacterium]